MNKLGNFNLKDVQNDAVFWEYTERVAGDADTAKEGAPEEMPVKRGQVCSLSFLILPFTFDFTVSCGVCELSVLLSSVSSLNSSMDVFIS